MKKLALFLTFVFIFTLTACNSADTQSNSENETTVTRAEDIGIDFEAQALIAAYCEGIWSGKILISDSENCASIEDGVLWINCKPQEEIPDMGIYEDCFWSEVISSDETGTWVQDLKLGVVELWSKGRRIEKIVLSTEWPYYTYVYKLQNCMVARYGEQLWVYDLAGNEIHSMIGVIDVYQIDGEILYSDFKNKNYAINVDGCIEELSSSYVRFPRKQVTLEKSSGDLLLTQAFNLYYGTDWDGTCRKVEDDFLAVDYYGNIVVNNKVVGNVSLGTEYVATAGSNISLDDEKSYYLNGSELVKFNRAERTSIDIPDGEAQFEWLSDKGIVIQIYGDRGNTICIVRENTDDTVDVDIVSTAARDCNVAYDTLYFMEGNTVYFLDWLDSSATPEVFIEGAYAISTHADEAEGALVPKEKANYAGYGYSNLYSPYGE